MMKIFSNNQLRIMETFLKNIDKPIYMREMQRLSGLDIKILSRELGILVDNNILDFEVRGKIKLYRLKNTIETELFMIAAESYKSFQFLEKYGITQFSELNRVTDFAIFGSYAEGAEKRSSDMDIAIFSEENKEIKAIIQRIPKKIHAQYIRFEEFAEQYRKDSILVREILRTHVLFGKHKEIVQMILRWKRLDGA